MSNSGSHTPATTRAVPAPAAVTITDISANRGMRRFASPLTPRVNQAGRGKKRAIVPPHHHHKLWQDAIGTYISADRSAAKARALQEVLDFANLERELELRYQ